MVCVEKWFNMASTKIAEWRTAPEKTCLASMSGRKTGVEHTEEEAEDRREIPGLIIWSQNLTSSDWMILDDLLFRRVLYIAV